MKGISYAGLAPELQSYLRDREAARRTPPNRGREQSSEVRQTSPSVGRRRSEAEQAAKPADAAGTPAASGSTASSNATTTPPASGELSIDQLAELYVKQYQEESGVSLTEEAALEKKTEVAKFYAQVSNGRERLDAIVFGNDTYQTA